MPAGLAERLLDAARAFRFGLVGISATLTYLGIVNLAAVPIGPLTPFHAHLVAPGRLDRAVLCRASCLHVRPQGAARLLFPALRRHHGDAVRAFERGRLHVRSLPAFFRRRSSRCSIARPLSVRRVIFSTRSGPSRKRAGTDPRPSCPRSRRAALARRLARGIGGIGRVLGAPSARRAARRRTPPRESPSSDVMSLRKASMRLTTLLGAAAAFGMTGLPPLIFCATSSRSASW